MAKASVALAPVGFGGVVLAGVLLPRWSPFGAVAPTVTGPEVMAGQPAAGGAG